MKFLFIAYETCAKPTNATHAVGYRIKTWDGTMNQLLKNMKSIEDENPGKNIHFTALTPIETTEMAKD